MYPEYRGRKVWDQDVKGPAVSLHARADHFPSPDAETKTKFIDKLHIGRECNPLRAQLTCGGKAAFSCSSWLGMALVDA